MAVLSSLWECTHLRRVFNYVKIIERLSGQRTLCRLEMPNQP